MSNLLKTLHLGLGVFALAMASLSSQAQTLTSGAGYTLSFPYNGTEYSILVTDSNNGNITAFATLPVRILVCAVQTLPTTETLTPGMGNEPQCPLDSNGAPIQNSYGHGYDTAKSITGGVKATKTFTTNDTGLSFTVVDTYTLTNPNGSQTAPTGAFVVERNITTNANGVTTPYAYNSEFLLGFTPTSNPGPAITAYHIFAPARWYDKNATVDPSGPAGSPGDVANGRTDYFWRETASGLPLIMLQDDSSGEALTLAHLSPAPQALGPIDPGDHQDWIVADGADYGSIGVQQIQTGTPHAVAAFYWPSEETQNFKNGATSWNGRSHTVGQGKVDDFFLMFRLYQYANYNNAMEFTWRTFSSQYQTSVGQENLTSVYNAVINNISDQYVNNAPAITSGPQAGMTPVGIPFNVSDPFIGPEDQALSLDMGYIGEQLPEAYEMWREGLKSSNSTYQNQGLNMLNFWANAEATLGQNLPYTDFVARTSGGAVGGGFTPTGYACAPLYMRTLVDGMEGVVEAATWARENPSLANPHPMWEQFANSFGQFLVDNQVSAGTGMGYWNRAYFPTTGQAYTVANIPAGSGCTPPSNSNSPYAMKDDVNGGDSLQTMFPIRFLVMLYTASGQTKYLTAIQKAAAWAQTNIYNSSTFIGGVENVDYSDKEGGIESLNGALAMYDLYKANATALDPSGSNAAQWLSNAQTAANYVETWMYAYLFNIRDTTAQTCGNDPNDNKDDGIASDCQPPNRFADYFWARTRATSIIASGGTAGDIAMSTTAPEYFRLAVLTPSGSNLNAHYLSVAQAVESNTKLTTQLTTTGSETPETETSGAGPLDPIPTAQQFGYVNNGLITEATDLVNMGFIKDDIGNGWGAWLSNSEADPFVRFDEIYGSYNIAAITGGSNAATTALTNKSNQVLGTNTAGNNFCWNLATNVNTNPSPATHCPGS